MNKLKELTIDKASDIALEKYGKEFCYLSETERDKVWELANEAVQDWLATQIDAERERRKYGEMGT